MKTLNSLDKNFCGDVQKVVNTTINPFPVAEAVTPSINFLQEIAVDHGSVDSSLISGEPCDGTFDTASKES